MEIRTLANFVVASLVVTIWSGCDQPTAIRPDQDSVVENREIEDVDEAEEVEVETAESNTLPAEDPSNDADADVSVQVGGGEGVDVEIDRDGLPDANPNQ